MRLHTIPGEGDMFSCLHVKCMNNTQNRCRKKGDSNQDFLEDELNEFLEIFKNTKI